MKYILKILLVMVVTFAIICSSYYGIHGRLPLPENDPETTVTKQAAVEKHSTKELVASLTNDKIYLYKVNNKVLLTVDSKQYEFNSWGREFDAIEPQIIYADFDEDKDKEIVIKAAEYKKSNGKYAECIYYLDPVEKNGKAEYLVSHFNKAAWTGLLDNTLVEEVTQLKDCKKIVQFAINYASVGIAYDKKTGLATNGYANYFSAICDDNKKYLDIQGWSTGDGEYSISADNKIFVDVPVLVNYNGLNAAQFAGRIHFQLQKGKNGKVVIGQKSLVFIPSSDYTVSDPTHYETSSWSYTEHNSDIIADDNDKKIDWIRYKTAFDPSITTQTISYAVTTTDIRSISDLTITNKYIRLVAKPNCKFDKSYKKGEYSVIINEGSSKQFDISYTAELTTDENNCQVLTITFDKSYPKSEIKTLHINYGAK